MVATAGVVDLRSDTVTRPTAAMRKAMAEAEVGDDVYGEDPTVRRLEERIAELLGKEAALWVPTGTMANQVALRAQTRHGDEVIIGVGTHCWRHESGALAALAGVQTQVVGNDGMFTAADVHAAFKAEDPYQAATRVVGELSCRVTRTTCDPGDAVAGVVSEVTHRVSDVVCGALETTHRSSRAGQRSLGAAGAEDQPAQPDADERRGDRVCLDGVHHGRPGIGDRLACIVNHVLYLSNGCFADCDPRVADFIRDHVACAGELTTDVVLQLDLRLLVAVVDRVGVPDGLLAPNLSRSPDRKVLSPDYSYPVACRATE